MIAGNTGFLSWAATQLVGEPCAVVFDMQVLGSLKAPLMSCAEWTCDPSGWLVILDFGLLMRDDDLLRDVFLHECAHLALKHVPRRKIAAHRATTIPDIQNRHAKNHDAMGNNILERAREKEAAAEAWVARAMPNLEASCLERWGHSFRSLAVREV